MEAEKLKALTALFQETVDLAGEPEGNEDWPLAHAEHLVSRLPAHLGGASLSRADLVRCLLDAVQEYEAMERPSSWSSFCAGYCLERLAASVQPQRDKLALYHFDTCPFCRLVRREIDRLGIPVELRDIYGDPRHRRDLVSVRGRPTVPVLRITTPEGQERWMPESRDIIRYLQASY